MEQQPPPMSGNPYPSPPPPAPQGYYTQPSEVPSRSGNPAFIFGLIFGLIAGVGFIVESILLVLVPPAPGIFLYMLILWGPPLLVQWIFYLLAGLFASWRTGKISTGVVASLWVNPGYLLGALVIFLFPRPVILRYYHVPHTMYTFLFLIFGIISLLLSVGSGIGFGALGGLIGKSQSKQKSGVAGRV